jgi:uncharacterized phiE125 gp8 family phage protein
MYVNRAAPDEAAAEAVVSVEIAKQFLRVTDDAEDELIADLVSSATHYAQEALGQQFVTASYTGYLNAFPAAPYIEVDYPPLQSVENVKYLDTSGTEQTLSASYYDVDIVRKPGRINLAYGCDWPSTYSAPNAVWVEFTCGYGDTAADVPENITLAVKTLLHEYYRNRGPTGEMPSQAYRLLSISSHGVP